MNFERLYKDVIVENLCVHCGTCVGICPNNAIKMSDLLGSCTPILKGKCNNCGLCHKICPGREVNFLNINNHIFDKIPQSLLGNYRQIFVGHANDNKIRYLGASGGVVSAILIYLIEMREIDGAIVLGFNEENPWIPEAKIACDRESILNAAQSKYIISPLNTILRDLRGKNGKFAFVGLPCHVQALRKMELIDPDVTKNIAIIVGIYCGNNMHFDATLSLLNKLGVSDLNKIKLLEYRAGDWPGNFKVTTKNNKTFFVKKFYYNYLIPFFIGKRCLLCIDFSNEFADISVGDGWLPEFKEKGGGWSAIIARTVKGEKILSNALEAEALNLREISEEEALNMHSHGLDFKKKGAPIRIKLRKLLGHSIPEYNVEYPVISFKRYIVEIFIAIIFFICSTNIAKKFIQFIPMVILGEAFAIFRKLWIKLTKF